MVEVRFSPIAALRNQHLNYNIVPSRFAPVCFALREGRLVFLGFGAGAEMELTLLAQRWGASLSHKADLGLDLDSPPSLHAHGTSFQCAVWRILLDIAPGHSVSYQDIAHRIDSGPRAVGAAVGANLISYFIPCHRVIRQDGGLGGFRWGLEVKRALLAAEGISLQ